MIDDTLIRLRELGATTGAPTWIPKIVLELEELQARLTALEQENEDLRRQLGFYRGRVAA
jgi:cell shape-determining protein MreC